ncbi:rhodanese-like domain-containing protein [uncultured Brevundimonas sp.]|uniref:rhodanese-like domain-containing protein n=1 Tax=uncultured Brevundimonas sp. TaxID=213418 RepID=UPI0030EDBD4D|tara:strand:+ start:537 stop:869 length:333 start_codon:yes stop_codon:yes gene_type:complete
MIVALVPLSPSEVDARLQAGQAVLIDIREPDEFAGEHIPGAAPAPLSGLASTDLPVTPGREVIFMCRSGGRTNANCDPLAARVPGQAFVLDGGLDGWKRAGLATSNSNGK